MGRPITVGATAQMMIKVAPKMRAAIAERAKTEGVTLSEAARQLIERGLKAKV
jgi:predicted HicB family RNase H-like nuclease